MRKLTKFEKIFIRIVKRYVKYYQNSSFKFYLDEIEYPVIGKSKKIIKVKFTKSKQVFKRIFTEGSLGLGECYCEGLINVADKDYKDFLFIFVKTIYGKRLLFNFDILRLLKAKFTGFFFTLNNQKGNINSHYSLSGWFENENDSNKFYLY